MTTRISLPPLSMILLCVACAERGVAPANVEHRDSAGTEIVAHRSLAPTGSWTLSAEPEAWIRGDERIAPFDRLVALALLGDGSVVVADGGVDRIHAFAGDGAYLWSAGGSGDGPGEFRVITHLFATPGDTVLVVDTRATRVTVVAPTGDVVRDVPFVGEAGVPAARLADGALLYMHQTPVGERRGGVVRTRASWSAVSSDGTSVRPLLDTPGAESFFGTGGGQRIVVRFDFMRRPLVAAWHDGFVLALSDRPQVDLHGPGGALVRSLRLPAAALSPAIPDAQAVRDAFVDRVSEEMRATFAELVATAPVPDRWPPVAALLADDVGRVWVQAHRPEDDPETVWHVFGEDGAYLDPVVIPGAFAPRAIRADVVAGVWRDEMDVESVRLYRIESVNEPGL